MIIILFYYTNTLINFLCGFNIKFLIWRKRLISIERIHNFGKFRYDYVWHRKIKQNKATKQQK